MISKLHGWALILGIALVALVAGLTPALIVAAVLWYADCGTWAIAAHVEWLERERLADEERARQLNDTPPEGVVLFLASSMVPSCQS
jgi:hypothetical protein